MSKATQTVHVDHVDFNKPEWADDNSKALVGYANGFEIELAPSQEKPGRFDWLVRLTAEISETPEVLGTGTSRSEHGAKWNAGLAICRYQKNLRKAERQAQAEQKLREQAKVKTEGMPIPPELQEPEQPEGPNGSEMLEATEKAVDQEMEKRPAVPAEPKQSKPRKARQPKHNPESVTSVTA